MLSTTVLLAVAESVFVDQRGEGLTEGMIHRTKFQFTCASAPRGVTVRGTRAPRRYQECADNAYHPPPPQHNYSAEVRRLRTPSRSLRGIMLPRSVCLSVGPRGQLS